MPFILVLSCAHAFCWSQVELLFLYMVESSFLHYWSGLRFDTWDIPWNFYLVDNYFMIYVRTESNVFCSFSILCCHRGCPCILLITGQERSSNPSSCLWFIGIFSTSDLVLSFWFLLYAMGFLFIRKLFHGMYGPESSCTLCLRIPNSFLYYRALACKSLLQ